MSQIPCVWTVGHFVSEWIIVHQRYLSIIDTIIMVVRGKSNDVSICDLLTDISSNTLI